MNASAIRRSVAAALLSGIVLANPARAEDTIDIASMTFRTGPYAATGTPLANGQRDYMLMLNERDGGINGIRLNYSECETGAGVDKGVECYDKTSASLVVQPGASAVALEVLPKAAADKRPLLVPGYGFSAMSAGKVFPWAFNPPVTYWDGASMMLKSIANGDLDSLRGKKIVLLHLEGAYGQEPEQLLQEYADTFGFTLLPILVGVKEMQHQAEQWQRIKTEQPDFVLLWGWGAMNAGALSEAAKTGFPMDKLVGIWWSGSDADLKAAGEEAKGYRLLSWNQPAPEAQAVQDIRKYVVAADKSPTAPDEVDGLLYQRGVLISMFSVEAVKAAQEHFDTRLVNAEQVRWGFENLKLDDDALALVGVDGMIAPFATSCADHSGRGSAWMLQWNGARFVRASDALSADPEMISPLVDAEAANYAQAHAPWPANDDCKM
ncbi:ABC transporter substrate-binding protein [Aminobacter sp. MET-1]|uniref:ABC transporter substrate-binding protein n=1 Tax=Aminobacter sp. MET-1 TaxID=2951085 RepID=UPI00226AC7F0|nr:ABC transporter substrate-binding protein [Aminobacter sp. MET-1]MCX8572972.1 ABC transporter substrate-binding protein [Aminobacter sp. MET-1]